jgi:hypothetical protein
MSKRILILALSFVTTAAAFTLQAQPFGGPRGPMSFGVMDLDNDGYVSTQEFSQHREARMAERAAQGRLLRNAGQAPRFARWDLDSDGRLSRSEVTAGQQARLAGRRAGGGPCWRNR